MEFSGKLHSTIKGRTMKHQGNANFQPSAKCECVYKPEGHLALPYLPWSVVSNGTPKVGVKALVSEITRAN